MILNLITLSIMISLADRTAIITGASRGIGAATAIKFSEAGAKGIVINYNRARDQAALVGAQCERLGAEVMLARADVSRPASVEKMIQRAAARFGSLDILVANAGIWKRAAIEEMTEREWDETINVNLKSIYACCRAAAQVMAPRRRGTIILVLVYGGTARRSVSLALRGYERRDHLYDQITRLRAWPARHHGKLFSARLGRDRYDGRCAQRSETTTKDSRPDSIGPRRYARRDRRSDTFLSV